MTYAYAIFGALIGLLLVFLGVGVQVSETYLFGLSAYVFSALAGAIAALGIRYVTYKNAGPISP
jgi:hypothetical protein